MEFKIKNVRCYGLNESMIASGYPMKTELPEEIENISDNDINRSKKLGNCNNGEGHDNFLKGIIVQFDVYGELYWWKQAQRYHWFDFVSSQSTMHSIMKFDIKSHCNKYVWDETIEKLKKRIDIYNDQEIKDKDLWYEIISNVPSGFLLGARMTTNYQQLKTMYKQRKNHKLDEWKEFCRWCETLPRFMEIITKN